MMTSLSAYASFQLNISKPTQVMVMGCPKVFLQRFAAAVETLHLPILLFKPVAIYMNHLMNM